MDGVEVCFGTLLSVLQVDIVRPRLVNHIHAVHDGFRLDKMIIMRRGRYTKAWLTLTAETKILDDLVKPRLARLLSSI